MARADGAEALDASPIRGAALDEGSTVSHSATASPAASASPVPAPWTTAQWKGITTVGQSLLVSAAAGSGKTAMLARRCAYLVCEAPPPYRCDVDELLVVTFTEAAAAEMRHRIHQALRERDAGAPENDDRLTLQLNLIDQAHISTLHSFCARLLRQHFHLVGLDPGFSVMDAEEARLLRTEIGRQLFQDRYALDEAGDFQRLVDGYADGDDERLLENVIRTHEMLSSLVDPADWLRRARRRLAQPLDVPIEQTEMGLELVELIGHRLTGVRQQCEGTIDLIEALGGFPKYIAQLRDMLQALRHWEQVLAAEGLDTLAGELSGLELPKLPSVRADVPNKEIAKSAMDAMKKAVKDGKWRQMLRFSSEQWRDGVTAMAPHARVFLDVVEQFGTRYRQAKDAARQLDFSDLERYALRVMRGAGESLSPSLTARAYHRYFKHVLVDEYQDINELQDAILTLVSHECLAAESGATPNLFCVGDVKQSIYRFRLADPQRFLAREKAARSVAAARAQVIDLQSNFRGRAPLLEAINGVFERLMTRQAAEIEYDLRHRLSPGLVYPSADGMNCFTGAPIEMHLLPAKWDGAPGAEHGDDSDDAEDFELDRAQREALLIARRIRALVGLDGDAPMQVFEKSPQGPCPRPIQLRDIVILLRSMRYKADQYADVLRRADVPVHAESGTGYFASVEVRDMLALLSLLDNQRQDIPMAAVLRGPLGGLPEPENALVRIRLAYGSRRQPVPFHQAVMRYADEQTDELAAHLRDFRDMLTRWRQLAQRRPLSEMLWSIYQDTGYLAYVAGLSGGEQRAANLMYLHERAAQFGTFQQRGLGRFLEFLDSLQSESDLSQPSIASEAEDVVRIMSVHRSKGLEFPVVILPDLGKAINLTECQGSILIDRTAGLGMAVVDEARQVRYPSMASTLVQDRLRRQAVAEELRVLYVAMTRAREHLILVGTCGETNLETWHARWSNHRGPLPPDTILDAGCPLDWLGPVAGCAPGLGGAIIRAIPHDSAEVAGWEAPASRRMNRQPSPWLATAARLEPLPHAPPADAAAAEVVRRLEFAYPFAAYADQRAVRSVTALVSHSSKLSLDRAELPAAATALPMPGFLLDQPMRSGADVGTATHLLLQHLDFSKPMDATGIDTAVRQLVDRRIIIAAHAPYVDRAAVCWFLQTELGRMVCGQPHRLVRELPIYFSVAPQVSGDAPPSVVEDRVMVRGRLDGLLMLDDESIIIDYKTDNVSIEQVPQRAEEYRPQLQQYKEAIGDITHKPVTRACLVFLKPRVIWDAMTGQAG